MKKLLSILFLVAVMTSGCVQTAEHNEVRYSDPDKPNENYIIMRSNTVDPDMGTFSLVTTSFVAGGFYTETSEAYTLRYGEYPVGVTLKKVDHGVDLGEGTYWYE